MVSRSYLLKQSAPPSASKRFFDQHILPAVIDFAGSCEALVETVLQRARRQPLGAIGIACGAGCLLGLLPRQRPGASAGRQRA
jgi:hypothetical protein